MQYGGALNKIMRDPGNYAHLTSKTPVRCVVNNPPLPSKVEREFDLKVGLINSEFGRHIKVRARSSLEAGLIIVEEGLIPFGYVAHSLVDPLA